MPSEEKIGISLFKESVKGKKHGDVVLDSLQKALARLNKEATKETTRLYESVFKKMNINNSTGLIVNSVENLALVSEMTGGLEPITDNYRAAYGQLIRDYREESLATLAEKESRIEHHLGKIDMREDRKGLTPEAFGQIAVLNEKNYRKVNALLLKWKDTVYDLFLSGVNRGLDLIAFRNSFYNKTGTIKIGSSLEEETVAASMQAVTEQRTAFVRQKAKENNYTYCWNANPMDPQTKPICLEASLAGVIPEGTMGTDYGFPPRHICRCEVVFTRREWVNINQGVNQAIRERRKVLIDALENAPKQKSYWFWTDPYENRKKVWSDDPLKASGDKMYKETADKLVLVNSKTVPDYKIGRGPRGGPPVGSGPPLALGISKEAKGFIRTRVPLEARGVEGVSLEFRNEILELLDEVPKEVNRLVLENETKILVGHHMSDIYPELKGVTPRGWRKGSTWDEASGGYKVASKEIAITEYKKGYGGRFLKSGDTRDVFPHEYGHAVDRSYMPGRNFSNDDLFVKAYNKDVEALSGDEYVEYFLQSGSAGRQETFAQLFSNHILRKDTFVSGDIRSDFKNSYDLVKKYIFEE
jgi:hypothetical protein